MVGLGSSVAAAKVPAWMDNTQSSTPSNGMANLRLIVFILEPVREKMVLNQISQFVKRKLAYFSTKDLELQTFIRIKLSKH